MSKELVINEVAYQRFLANRREEILERIESAAKTAGRLPSEVCVLAVSKTVDVAAVREAHTAGWNAFAENRPQELVRKLNELQDLGHLLRFDMIGNLQTNKINQVLCRAELIHSVSSLHLAEAISKRAALRAIRAQVLLEVNVSGEVSKSGFAPAELRTCFEALLELEGLNIAGLMTMAPQRDSARARKTFEGLRLLRDELEECSGHALPELSCGMSDDFSEAIQEGSTIVRLGRVVFDERYTF